MFFVDENCITEHCAVCMGSFPEQWSSRSSSDVDLMFLIDENFFIGRSDERASDIDFISTCACGAVSFRHFHH